MTTFFHGAHTSYTLHEGQCYTDDIAVALRYCAGGRNGRVARVDIDLSGLVVEECEGYDHDENDCPADCEDFRAAAAARGVDVLRYEDEDDTGRRHDCYRLVSPKALAAVTVKRVLMRDDADEAWN